MKCVIWRLKCVWRWRIVHRQCLQNVQGGSFCFGWNLRVPCRPVLAWSGLAWSGSLWSLARCFLRSWREGDARYLPVRLLRSWRERNARQDTPGLGVLPPDLKASQRLGLSQGPARVRHSLARWIRGRCSLAPGRWASLGRWGEDHDFR